MREGTLLEVNSCVRGPNGPSGKIIVLELAGSTLEDTFQKYC